MEYIKQFDYEGITILFDKFVTNKEYPTFYIPIKYKKELPVFIPKLKLKCTGILKVNDGYKVASFGFDK